MNLFQIGDFPNTMLENEWEQEKRRVLDGLLWGGVALIILGVVLALLCALAVDWLAPQQSATTIGWVAVLVVLCGWALARWSQRHLGKHGKASNPHQKGTA